MYKTKPTHKDVYYFTLAQANADMRTDMCQKVRVGAVVINSRGNVISMGCNHTFLNCDIHGCNRIRKHGSDDKAYRFSGDCGAIHAEIDAIANARESLEDATIYVTRYPCEECMKAILQSGIRTIKYGRKEPVSETTKFIVANFSVQCSERPVSCQHVDWSPEE